MRTSSERSQRSMLRVSAANAGAARSPTTSSTRTSFDVSRSKKSSSLPRRDRTVSGSSTRAIASMRSDRPEPGSPTRTTCSLKTASNESNPRNREMVTRRIAAMRPHFALRNELIPGYIVPRWGRVILSGDGAGPSRVGRILECGRGTSATGVRGSNMKGRWSLDAGRVTRAYDDWHLSEQELRAFLRLASAFSEEGYAARWTRILHHPGSEDADILDLMDRDVDGLIPHQFEWLLGNFCVRDGTTLYEVYLEKALEEVAGFQVGTLPVGEHSPFWREFRDVFHDVFDLAPSPGDGS